jgi:diacylglycerol kinase
VLELLNSVVERFVDVVKPRIHHYAMDIKDIMAAAVFVASLGALIVGIVILGPHVFVIIRDYFSTN